MAIKRVKAHKKGGKPVKSYVAKTGPKKSAHSALVGQVPGVGGSVAGKHNYGGIVPPKRKDS